MMPPMSSTIASASSMMRSPNGTRVPTTARTPSANAMSVARGMPQPDAPGLPITMTAKIAAGTTMPPMAPAMGTITRRGSDSSPTTISRLISSPTTKKKITIAASLIQKWRDASRSQMPKSTARW
jgi:hypothetical protein